LFEPVAIGPLTLKNRVVMAPMTTFLDLGGTGRYEAFYDARARGGAAMITLNLQAVWPGVPPRGAGADAGPSGLLALNHDRHIPRLAALTARLRADGALVCAQLAAGAAIQRELNREVATLSPSGIEPAGPGVRPDVASLPFFLPGRTAGADELAGVVNAVAQAARRAVEAGFDAVQVSAAGGSLLAQFLNPQLNARDDDYGGDLTGRARLALDTLRAVRAAVPSSMALLCRINGDDLVPGAMSASDYAELVPLLEDAGAQAIDILPGGFLSRAPVNQSCVPEGAFAPVSRALRGRARVPVIAGTRISTPGCAARLVARGDADVVSLGTALIADPDWPAKARDRRERAIRPCTACCRCWNDLAERHVAIGCSVNPAVGEEHRPAEARTTPRYRVTVVGAGVAGLSAAVDAARAGHDVTVIDRRAEVGGLLVDVARLPFKNGVASFLEWLAREAADCGATLRLGVEATSAEVIATRPDVVILAAGHVPAGLGPDGGPERRARSCADVLGARVFVGASAVVLGAGRDACETAEWLAMAGFAVTLVATDPGRGLGTWTRWTLLDRLETLGVRIVPDTEGADREAAAAIVVRAGGLIPATALEEPLGTAVRLVIARGNPDAEDGIGEAVLAGQHAALAI
jgi:2,4-dienoyl-CoA reductase (NADPH2)